MRHKMAAAALIAVLAACGDPDPTESDEYLALEADLEAARGANDELRTSATDLERSLGEASSLSEELQTDLSSARDERDEALQEQEEAVADLDGAVAERNSAQDERDEAITKQDEVVAERDEAIAERDEAIVERDLALAQLEEDGVESDANDRRLSDCEYDFIVGLNDTAGQVPRGELEALGVSVCDLAASSVDQDDFIESVIVVVGGLDPATLDAVGGIDGISELIGLLGSQMCVASLEDLGFAE